MAKLKIALLGLLLGFGIPMLLTSCGVDEEKEILNQTSGILKVESVKTIDSKFCEYTLASDDIRSNLYYTCECGKLEVNSRAIITPIDEVSIQKEEEVLIIEDNKVTKVKVHKTEELTETISKIEAKLKAEYKMKLDSVIKSQKTTQ